MGAKLYDLARMYSSTTGTGSSITLTAAVLGCLTFAAAGVQDGDVVSYAISDGVNAEVGTATAASGATVLTGRTPTRSTNSGAAINLSGTQQVFVSFRAEDYNTLLQSTNNLGDVSNAASARANILAIGRVADFTALAALDPTKDPVAFVYNIGVPDIFVWKSGNYSSFVAADPGRGWYVASTNVSYPSTVGAWLRCPLLYNAGMYPSACWGVGPTATDNAPLIEKAQTAVATFGGGTLLHPPGVLLYGASGITAGRLAAIQLKPTVNWKGSGRGVTQFKMSPNVQKFQDAFTGYIDAIGQLHTPTTLSRTYNSTAGAHADQIVGGRDSSGVLVAAGLYPKGLNGTDAFGNIYQLCDSAGNNITSTTVVGSSGSPIAMCTVPDALMYSGIMDDNASTYDSLVLEDFDVDMNAANNKASNGVGIWGSAYALAVQRGAGIRVRRVGGVNHGGSNTFLFGQNIDIAAYLSSHSVTALNSQTVTGFIAEELYAANNGDLVNPACLDHSTLWGTIYGGGVFNSVFLNGFTAGATRICTAIEMHGYRAAVNDNFIYGYAAGINLANEKANGSLGNRTSENLSARGNEMDLVCYGIVVWCVWNGTTSGFTTGITIAENQIKLDPSNGIRGIDAESQVSSTNTGKATGLVITKNIIRCVWAGASGTLVIGSALGKWETVTQEGNYVEGMNGPALWASGQAYTTSTWRIANEIYRNCGVGLFDNVHAPLINNTQYQSYIYLIGVTTLADLEIDGIIFDGPGTTTYGITGGMAAGSGFIAIKSVAGVTTSTANYTGGVPIVLDSWGPINVGTGLTAFTGVRGRTTKTS